MSSTSEALVAAFLSRRVAEQRRHERLDRERLAAELAKAVCEGAHRWPSAKIADEVFARFLGDLLAGDDRDPIESLRELHLSDLYLACGCLLRQAGAIRAFDQAFLRGIDASVRVVGSTVHIDEVRQLLRERLLFGAGTKRPKLASYAGRGPLVSWLAVAAQRAALSLRRQQQAGPERVAIDELVDAVTVLEDTDLACLRSRCEPHLREILPAVFGTLSPRDRRILRLKLVEGLSLEQIGRMYTVNASTVSRWLAASRQFIREQVELALAERLGLRSDESISLTTLMAGDFEISVGDLLT